MALALDGSASGTTSCTLTCASGDVLVCYVLSNGTVSSLSDNSGASTTWQQRGTPASGAGFNVTEWWSTSTGAWSAKVITPTSGGSVFATQVSAWSGGNTSSPFDGSAVIGNATNSVNITTTAANTVVLGGGASGSGGGNGIGYTQLFFSNFETTEYQAFSSPQTAKAVDNLGSGDIGMIADALVEAAAGDTFANSGRIIFI